MVNNKGLGKYNGLNTNLFSSRILLVSRAFSHTRKNATILPRKRSSYKAREPHRLQLSIAANAQKLRATVAKSWTMWTIKTTALLTKAKTLFTYPLVKCIIPQLLYSFTIFCLFLAARNLLQRWWFTHWKRHLSKKSSQNTADNHVPVVVHEQQHDKVR